jgi:ornithine cyclodeaminase/alanine dehydrogenase-like protein (mu-crystallin family)
MLLLNARDLHTCLDLKDLVKVLAIAYKGFEKYPPMVPTRTMITNDSDGSFSLFMPASIPTSSCLGIKISSYYPQNRISGNTTINGITVLIDKSTGLIKALLDSAFLTAVRTSAISALATQILAKPEASTLALIGAGVQARAHLLAMCSVRPINTVYVTSLKLETSIDLAHQMKNLVDAKVIPVSSVEQAVMDADIVCTVTSHASSLPLVVHRKLKKHVHINAIGGSTLEACEIDPQMLSDVSVYVDDFDSAIRESGEISRALELSIIRKTDIHDLVALLNGRLSNQRLGTYFRSVGNAVQDMIVAEYLYKRAVSGRLGIELDYFGNK